MSILSQLVAFTLRQVLGETADAVGQAVAGRFSDPSQALPKAIGRAGERTWQGLAVALAGDGLVDRLKGFFARGEDKALREQLRLFLETTPGLPLTAPEVRRLCLAELQQLRQAGHLAVDRLNGDEVGRQTASLARYGEPQRLLDGAWEMMDEVAQQLAPAAPNLAALLRQRPADGPPLLVAVFSFFLRREVTRDKDLCDELFFDQLHSLIAAQRKGFAQLSDALEALGGQLDLVLDQLIHIGEVVDATHAKVVRLEGLIEDLAQRNHIRPGDLGRLVVSINSASEQELLRRIRDEYRQLPPEQQKASHLLLLGDSLNAAGLFALAQKSHEDAARRAAAEKQRDQLAEASFKEFRSACEQALWAEAMPALLRAARLDPERFAPFPLERYAVQGILGSGGFGTVFLCHDTLDEEEAVAIKAMHTADLGRSIQEVFREASTLKKLREAARGALQHVNAIIGVRHWDFADGAKTRPYIVMDYFPGVSLEEHLRCHGVFALPAALPLLRQLARGMKAAHQRGVWHRDLKPANVLLRKRDGGWEVKIIDFGLAVQEQAARYSVARPVEQRSRQERSYAGTWDYAPPEQRGKSSDPVGPHSDVYSFGKTACEALLLTNEPRISDLKKLPGVLAELLDRCIAAAVRARPSFEEILAVLENLIEQSDPVKQRQREETERRRREEEERQRLPERWTSPTLNAPFVLVPAGSAWLGGGGGEPGTKQIAIPQTFYLSTYPVTQAQWQVLMGNNPSYFSRHGTGKDSVKGISDVELIHFPVEQISWEDVQEFLKKLNAQERNGEWWYRLPTEAEWEYTCRGGPVSKELSAFDFYFDKPTNDLSSDRANCGGHHPAGRACEGESLERTSRVGLYPANALGLHDMHGNVWEWCNDEEDSNRVIRGGGWFHYDPGCRAAGRLGYEPTFRFRDLGFRLARVPSGNKA